MSSIVEENIKGNCEKQSDQTNQPSVIARSETTKQSKGALDCHADARSDGKNKKSKIPDGWHEVKLGNVCKIIGGYAFKSSLMNSKQGNYQIIKMGNVYNGVLDLSRSPSFIDTILPKEQEYLLEKDDILISLTGTTGKRDFGYIIKINKEKNLLLNQRLAMFKSKKIKPDFLYPILKTKKFEDSFFDLAKGGTGNQTNVSIKDVSNLKIIIPINIKEQEAIADILSGADEVIEATKEKIDLLKRRKDSLVQKLLSPKPHWVEKKLGDIFDYVPTYSFSRAELNYDTNNVMCIHYGDIHSNFPIIVDIENENNNDNMPKLNDGNEINNEYLLKEGDLIIADASEDYEGVGKSILITNLQNQKAVSGLHTFVLRDNKGLTDKIYRGYFLYENNTKNKIRRIATGASVLGISKTNLAKIKVFIPPTTEEQGQIASVLSICDEEIKLYEQKLKTLENQKTGLMQKLLTGKWRVQIN